MFESEKEVFQFGWDIQREGRSWKRGEVRARHELTPEKIELIEGKLFWSEEDRLTMLALLLENLGVCPSNHPPLLQDCQTAAGQRE